MKAIFAWQHVIAFFIFWAIVLSAIWLFGCKSSPPGGNSIPNFFVVSQTNRIYRGAEPTLVGWQELRDLGVTNVVKLDTDAESTDSNALIMGMVVRRFPITTEQQLLGPLTKGLVEKAVNAITPGTYVHCGSDSRSNPNSLAARFGTQGGQDRTGLIIACYRVDVQGWPKDDARAEMLKLGFHPILHGLNEYWENFTPH
jgi:tyrosine-protein phosphatase SIW14